MQNSNDPALIALGYLYREQRRYKQQLGMIEKWYIEGHKDFSRKMLEEQMEKGRRNLVAIDYLIEQTNKR